jgi:hypothetical protein
MNIRALKVLTKVSEELDAIAEATRDLHSAVENSDEEGIEDALKQFPSSSRMSNTFAKLGELLTVKPWERKGKKDA